MSAPLLSVVIPVYNAAPLLHGVYEELSRALEGFGPYEIIFADDASSDAGLECLRALAQTDSRVKVLAMEQNCGQQEATLAGLAFASGRYCATMDDDGQHPAHLLPQMVAKLRDENMDIVYAVPQGRRENALRTLGGRMRDALFALLFPYCGKTRVSSCRVMTRELARRVLARRGSFNYFSAMVFQEPVRAATVPYPFRPCGTGRSGYTAIKLIGLYCRIFLHYGPFGRQRAAARPPRAAKETRGFD